MVICGGTSTVRDMQRLPRVVHRLIGVNQHALLLPLDYIVFYDEHMRPLVDDHPARKITHKAQPDNPNYIWAMGVPTFNMSGPAAVSAAMYMGFDEIHVVGADCYQSARHYWHSPPSGEGDKRSVYATNGTVWRQCAEHGGSRASRVRWYNPAMQALWEGHPNDKS